MKHLHSRPGAWENMALPMVLMVTGLVLLGGDYLGILSLDRIQNFWPVAVIAIGLVELVLVHGEGESELARGIEKQEKVAERAISSSRQSLAWRHRSIQLVCSGASVISGEFGTRDQNRAIYKGHTTGDSCKRLPGSGEPQRVRTAEGTHAEGMMALLSPVNLLCLGPYLVSAQSACWCWPCVCISDPADETPYHH